MKRIIALIIAAVCVAGMVCTDAAKRKTASRKTTRRTAVTKPKTAPFRTFELDFEFNDMGHYKIVIRLNPGGQVIKYVYYATQHTWESYGTSHEEWDYNAPSVYYGNWQSLRRYVGKQLQYYFSINVDGDSYYYIAGYPYLFRSFISMCNYDRSNAWRVGETYL